MARFVQIIVLFGIIQWSQMVVCNPFLEGISVNRKFDISLKPLRFKPFTYLREKWGPFGSFGQKHAIAKRDLEGANAVQKNEVISNSGSLNDIIPQSVPATPAISVPPPIMTPTVNIPPRGLNTNIDPLGSSPVPNMQVGSVGPSPAPVFEALPPEDTIQPSFNFPSRPINSGVIPASVVRENVQNPTPSAIQPPRVVPIAPINRIPTVVSPSPGMNEGNLQNLNTGIVQPFPVNNYVNPSPVLDNGPTRVNLLVPPTASPTSPQGNANVPNQETPARRGILVRLFGDLFLQLITRLLNTARSSFGQFSIPQNSIQ